MPAGKPTKYAAIADAMLKSSTIAMRCSAAPQVELEIMYNPVLNAFSDNIYTLLTKSNRSKFSHPQYPLCWFLGRNVAASRCGVPYMGLAAH